MAEEDDVILHPPWREALQKFIGAGFEIGSTVPLEWFFEALGVDMPSASSTVQDADRARWQFVSGFEALRARLLEDHQIALANVRGVGYRIVPPSEQTAWAEREGIAAVKASVVKMGHRLANVDMTALDAVQRRENADALARLSQFAGMVRRVEERRSVLAIDDGT